MSRCVGIVCVVLAAASMGWGGASSTLRREASREHRRRRRAMSVEERLAEQTLREIEAEHRRLIRREAEVAPEYRTEASLIYLDRERAAQRDPFELQRERDRRLAAERYRLDGLRFYSAADYRLGSETRLIAGRRGYGGPGGYGHALRRAEQGAIDSAIDVAWRDEQRRQAIIRRVLAVASKLEQEARGGRPQPPRKSAWRRFSDFITGPFRRE